MARNTLLIFIDSETVLVCYQNIEIRIAYYELYNNLQKKTKIS